MKISLLFLSLSIAPTVALAQPTKKATPQVVVEPAAKALLDQATATYKAAQGIRFKLLMKENETDSHYSVSFKKPNLLRVDAEGKPQLIVDGKATYTIQGTQYERGTLPTTIASLWQRHLQGGVGALIPDMLEGRSPLMTLQDDLKQAPFNNIRIDVKVPSPTTVNGVALHGAKIILSGNTRASTQTKAVPLSEVYLWFADDGLLRRISTRTLSGPHPFSSVEQISDQELSPAFAADTFKFDATGLQPKAQPVAQEEEEAYFDPRLKKGAAPSAFTATDLNGQTISPAKYKGKVLILDFWATWCGPCVAAMPNVKSVYNKYHSKGLEIVGISLDEDKKALTSFIKNENLPWAQIYDGKGWKSRISTLYGVQAIPFMLVIGKDGKIAAVEPEENLESVVKTALEAK